MLIIIMLFGFKYGFLFDVDFVFDVRFILNLFYVDIFKYRIGKDFEVKEYVLRWDVIKEFL